MAAAASLPTRQNLMSSLLLGFLLCVAVCSPLNKQHAFITTWDHTQYSSFKDHWVALSSTTIACPGSWFYAKHILERPDNLASKDSTVHESHQLFFQTLTLLNKSWVACYFQSFQLLVSAYEGLRQQYLKSTAMDKSFKYDSCLINHHSRLESRNI
eukprot:577926-Pelagomonas_calceolata.AAC.12